MNRINKIALIGCENSGSRKLFEAITYRYWRCEYMMVFTDGLYYKKSFMASVIKVLKEASWLFIFVRFYEVMIYRIKGDTITKKCKQLDIPFIHTKDINSEQILEKVREFAPDIIVSLYTMQIYKNGILSIPIYGAINSHPAKLPEYRGLEVFFWQMANSEKETAVSVFYLTDKVDVGEVIEQETVPILDTYSMQNLYDVITEVAG